MKRFLTILLAIVMTLSTLATLIVGVAANAGTATSHASTEELYLSDITPTSWKILDGCTPGYNVYYEDGTPLLLGGVTYDKGLSTHPGGGFDAEFVYDISGYDYTTFSAIVGKTDRYVAALPGSVTSFHVYLDGVLADEVIDLVAGETYTFDINVAGASELKLVTSGGSDNITCDGSIWANTKLSYDKVDPELYLSDITPTGWKILDGCTPGYNVYYEDGTPLLLGGVTYDKGLSTHPGGGFDAEFVYDISGYDYTTFSAIVGKTDRYVAALPGSVTSFHVYLDGVLADEVIDLVAGETYTFDINVAGASELKLVTSGGSDNITCDGSIWANAKLSYEKIDAEDPPVDPPVDPEDPPVDPADELYLSDTTPNSVTAFSGPFYNKNEQGEALLLNGITYDKGIWTHPMPDREAEAIYDVSGYDYTTFYAVVGKEQKYVNALPGSLLTFRVYVDGVLVDEVVDLVAGKTHVFQIDITGASELKLVTGCGSDNITCDGSIWANAKLSYEKIDPENPPVDPPVDPEDPPVDPEDPPVDPEDPPVDPEDPPVGPPVDPGKALYLSDILPKSTSALSGPFYDVNEQGEELLLDGYTYEKGIWTHPMPNKEAESIYDISAYDYTIFYAIVGKEQKYVNALPDSLLTFRVYVDGVLVDEVVDLVAGETYIFKVDISGASELKLVTGCGSDNITCDGSIWADAKLTTDADNCGEHIWGEGRIIKAPTCSEVGQMQYQCMNCIGDKIEDIPVVPHTAGSWVIGEQASCTETGTKVQKCTECGEIVNTTVWDAKGHIPGVWLTTKSATCTETGTKTQTCQTCGTVLEEEEIPVRHFFGDWGFIDGKQVRVCECGAQEFKDGCASQLSVGAITMMLLAVGTMTFLLSKKKDKIK